MTASPAPGRYGPLLMAMGLLLLLAGVTAALGWRRVAQLSADNQQLTAAAAELDRLRADQAELEKLRHLPDEVERLRKQTQEIHKLRAQYQEWQRLRTEHATLEAQVAQLQAQLQQARTVQPTAPSARPGAGGPLPPGSAWLGIAIQPLSRQPEVQAQTPGVVSGVVVTSLVPGGPAESSGLRVGDVILSVDGRPVGTAEEVQAVVRAKTPGQPVHVQLMREGQLMTVAAPTTPAPAFD